MLHLFPEAPQVVKPKQEDVPSLFQTHSNPIIAEACFNKMPHDRLIIGRWYVKYTIFIVMQNKREQQIVVLLRFTLTWNGKNNFLFKSAALHGFLIP